MHKLTTPPIRPTWKIILSDPLSQRAILYPLDREVTMVILSLARARWTALYEGITSLP